MMLHKIFHLNESVGETRRLLTDVGSYRHHLGGVERAEFTGHDISQWEITLALGFKADFVLTKLDSTDRNTVVFKSLDGDLEIMGMVKFNQIRIGLTEVEVMVNYESKSLVFNLLDRMFNLGDYFMLNQLRRVRAHFESVTMPASVRTVNFCPQLKAA